MESSQRIVCQWCQTQNLTDAATCHSCGAPLDLRRVINVGTPAALTLPPAPVPIGYLSAPIARETAWATVANFRYCGELHAARALLSRVDIVSRIGPALDDSPEFELQTPVADAEWARDMLARKLPQATSPARPTGGFPVIMAGAAPNAPPPVVGARPVLPLAALPAMAPPGAGYYLMLTALWIILILIVLSMIVVCLA